MPGSGAAVFSSLDGERAGQSAGASPGRASPLETSREIDKFIRHFKLVKFKNLSVESDY